MFRKHRSKAGTAALLILSVMMMFCLSSCGREEEPEPVVQVPYYIGAVLASSESETSEELKNEITRAFGALETETAGYRLSFLYSEGEVLDQERCVSTLIAQGMDAVFVELISPETASAVHDLLVDAGGTYGVFVGTDPGEGVKDSEFIYVYAGDTGASAQMAEAAATINGLLIPAPEPEEGEEAAE